jgi:hypothetical protein
MTSKDTDRAELLEDLEATDDEAEEIKGGFAVGTRNKTGVKKSTGVTSSALFG